KSPAELMVLPPPLLPARPLFYNFVDAWTRKPFTLYLGNTVVYTGLGLLGQLVSCTLVAYGFARIRFHGRNVLFILLLATLMLPSQVTLIPQYLLFRQLGWLDTLWPLIVPQWFGNAFYIFLLRQFLLTIPR